jgi:hypothetical protein
VHIIDAREEIVMELFSKSDHLMMELAGSEVNHENVGPDRVKRTIVS